MQASDIKGRAVVTLADAAKVGTVDDILFDPRYQRVEGFVLKEGRIGGSKAAIPRGRVKAIGPDAVTVASAEEIGPTSRFSELQNTRSLGQAQGTKVVTEKGELLGTLDGFELDDEMREVRTCRLATPLLGRLLNRQDTFVPQHIRQVGEGGLMVVDDDALRSDSTNGE
ncbi:MAG: PRC-barrel domain-containing protein [Nitrososphaerota archaeon]